MNGYIKKQLERYYPRYSNSDELMQVVAYDTKFSHSIEPSIEWLEGATVRLATDAVHKVIKAALKVAPIGMLTDTLVTEPTALRPFHDYVWLANGHNRLNLLRMAEYNTDVAINLVPHLHDGLVYCYRRHADLHVYLPSNNEVYARFDNLHSVTVDFSQL